MNAFLLVGSLTVLVQLAFGLSGECQSEVATFKSCLEAAKGNEGPSDAQKAAWEAKKAANAKCFTDNGCQDPAVKHKQTEDCKKQVFEEQIKPKLENCSGIQLPEFEGKEFKPKFHGGFRGGKEGRGHGDDKKEEFFSEVCPSTNASVAVESCLKALHNESRQDGKGHRRNGTRKPSEKMQAVRQCFKALNASCKQELEQAKKTICQCAESQIANDSEIEASLDACVPAEKEASGDSEEESNKPTKLQRLVKKICKQGGHGGKGKRHGGKGRWNRRN